MKIAVIIGLLIVLAGASLILSAFHIHFPLFRAALGATFGWVGLSLMLSALGVDKPWLAFRPQGATSRSTTPFAGGGAVREESVIFSSRTFDASDLAPGEHLKVSVIFGDATVRYDPEVAVEVRTSTAFGNTVYPDGVSIAFGERVMFTPACEGADARAVLEVATVFGQTKLVAAPAPLLSSLRPTTRLAPGT